MASSNKHWPSMFKKSKLSNPHHHNGTTSTTTAFQRSSTPYSLGGDGKSGPPGPKPRWNPKPEQIRILEAIFNSGMVNPPRDEIRKIRIQLQQYGPVGDANVFYWFQNRKSRNKHKLRHLQKNNKNNSTDGQAAAAPQQNATSPQITTAPSSSNSSSSSASASEKSSPQSDTIGPHKGFNQQAHYYLQTPQNEMNSTTFFHDDQLPLASSADHLLSSFPMQQQHHHHHHINYNNIGEGTQGFYLPDQYYSNMVQHQPQHNNYNDVIPYTSTTSSSSSSSVLLSEILGYGHDSTKKLDDHVDPLPVNEIISHTSTSTGSTLSPPIISTVPSPSTQFPGDGEAADCTEKCTVFINGVAFEVAVGPFNVHEAFGDGAVLLDSTGFPVLTDDWGVTLYSLHHAASYYLL